MNIILIISDSLTIESSLSLSSVKECSLIFNNHWTNATWTLPSIATIVTGEIPNDVNEVYQAKPHRIYDSKIENSSLWNSVYGKYYVIVSSPWDAVTELLSPLSYLIGATFIKSDSPYKFVIDQDSYYKKRFDRRVGVNIRSIPQPFFHIYHYTRTHSEFGLSPDQFKKIITEKNTNKLKKAMDDQVSNLKETLEFIIDQCPNETIIILTSDHGEDFKSICNLECGHADTFTKDVMKVPLYVYYKGTTKKFEKSKVEDLSTHKDLYNQIILWINSCNKENLPITPVSNDNTFVFSQGSQIEEKSLKFLKDNIVGVWDENRKIIYIQSIITEEEKFLDFDGKYIEDVFIDKDFYRKKILSEIPKEKSNLQWTRLGKKCFYDEF